MKSGLTSQTLSRDDLGDLVAMTVAWQRDSGGSPARPVQCAHTRARREWLHNERCPAATASEFPDEVVRIVSENAAALRFGTHGFEQQ